MLTFCLCSASFELVDFDKFCIHNDKAKNLGKKHHKKINRVMALDCSRVIILD